MNELHHEAELFARYMIDKPGNALIYERYVNGVTALNLSLTVSEERMVHTLKKKPFLLPFCDAGLALLSPQNTLRKRLLLMYALIETDKDFTDAIINAKDQSFAFARFVLRGCIGIFKVVFGVLLILLMGWRS